MLLTSYQVNSNWGASKGRQHYITLQNSTTRDTTCASAVLVLSCELSCMCLCCLYCIQERVSWRKSYCCWHNSYCCWRKSFCCWRNLYCCCWRNSSCCCWCNSSCCWHNSYCCCRNSYCCWRNSYRCWRNSYCCWWNSWSPLNCIAVVCCSSCQVEGLFIEWAP